WPGCATEDLRIEVYELAGRKSEVLLSDYRLQYGLVWTRNNRILFSRAEEPPNQGQSNVWSLEVDRRPGWPGGAPVRLTSGPDWKPVINMSADGKHAVFIRTNIEPAAYVADVHAKTREIGRLERLTHDEWQSRPYEWAPDGKSVLFVSDREGTFHIFRQQVGAAAPELVAGVQGSPNILRLNPERTEILYSVESDRKTADARPTETSSQNSGVPARRATNSQPEGEFQSTNVRLMRIPLDGASPCSCSKIPASTIFSARACPRASVSTANTRKTRWSSKSSTPKRAPKRNCCARASPDGNPSTGAFHRTAGRWRWPRR